MLTAIDGQNSIAGVLPSTIGLTVKVQPSTASTDIVKNTGP